MLAEKLSEKSSTQARTPDLEMPVGLKPGSCGAPGTVTELGLGPRLLTCQRNQPRTEQAGVGSVPHLLKLHSVISWLGEYLDMTALKL